MSTRGRVRAGIGVGVAAVSLALALGFGGCASGQTASQGPSRDGGAPDCCSSTCSDACVRPEPQADSHCSQPGEACQGASDCCDGNCQSGTCAAPVCGNDASDGCAGEASAPPPEVDCPSSPCEA